MSVLASAAMVSTAPVVFAAYSLTSQAVLLLYFVCRRWQVTVAERYGWIAYACGWSGAVVGLGLAVVGAPWQIFAGPLLLAAWAAFGAWADLLARTEWRRPVRWAVFGPYVVLYLAAQMFLWWPLWNVWRAGWVVYLVLFVANTGLNMTGHISGSSTRAGQGA